jgi:hypothetical protein
MRFRRLSDHVLCILRAFLEEDRYVQGVQGRYLKAVKIYFIQAGNNGPIKIGFSRNPQNRLIALSEYSPFPLRMVAQIEGTFGDEGKLHKRFSQYKIKGEWFHPSGELLEYVKTIPYNQVVDICDPAFIAKRKQEAIEDWFQERAKARRHQV